MKSFKILRSKKRYIEVFLRNEELKWRKAEIVLRFLARNADMLQRIHFVDQISGYDNAILVSASSTSTYPFICQLYGKHFHDPIDIISVLKHDPPEEIYLWLSYQKKTSVEPVANYNSNVSNHHITLDVEKEIKKVMLKSPVREEWLWNQINLSLDKGDAKSFEIFTRQLKNFYSN